MKYSDFLKSAPVKREDLFGPWKQKRVHLDEPEDAWSPLVTNRLNWIRRKFSENQKTLNIPMDADATFKRSDVNGKAEGEWVLISVDGKPFKCFSASSAGFQEMPLNSSSSVVSVTKPNAETVTCAESVPYELRTGWVNRALLEKNNAKCEMRAVKYWNKKYPGTY